MPTRFDAIVIGTGQAGPALAARLAKSGRRTAVLERHLFGGTCVNTGCMPTKTMVASARAIHMASRGAEFGFTVHGAVEVDLPRVRARRDAVVRDASGGLEKWMKGTPHVTVFEGHGFMRALVDADSKQLLGAVIFGVGGDEVVHSLADVMYAKAPYTTISRAVHIHPTISELIPTMLQELQPLG